MLPITLARLRRATTFVLSFGLAKGLAFGGVLLLPRLLDPVAYGAVELALSVGLLGAGILGLGTVAAAARLHLVEGERHTEPLLATVCGWSALAGFVAGAVALALGAGSTWALCLFACGLFAFQLAAASYVRFRDLIHAAGWFDHAAILAFTVSATILWALGHADVVGMAWAAAALSIATLAAAAAIAWRAGASFDRTLIGRAIRIGWPMMVNGLVLAALVGSQRIAIAKLMTLADVALFSVCARLAMLLVLVHQVVTTGLFQRLYRLSKDRIDPVFAAWIAFISTIACAMTFVFRLWPALFVHGTGVSPDVAAHLFPAVAAMTTLWICSANIEMFVGRELKAGQAAAIVALVAAGFALLGAFLLQAGQLSLIAICLLYAGAIAVSVWAQMALLVGSGISFRRSWLALPLAFAPLLFYVG